MDKLHIRALRHSAFYSPLLYTIAGGLLADEGLSASYDVAGPGKTVDGGIREGTVQLAQSAVSTSFAPLERGEAPPYLHFAQINARDGFFIVGRKPEPDFTWQDLAGKRVLLDHFFQPLAMFKYAAHLRALDFDRIEAIDAGGVEEMDAAFRAGRGDYVHLQGPAAQQLEHDSVGWVVASVGEAIGEVAFSSLCASREWLATQAARAFTRAYRRARLHVQQSPAEEIAAALKPHFPRIDATVLTRTIAAYQRLGCWGGGMKISRAAYERALDVFMHGGSISRRHAYEQVIAPPLAD